MKIKTTITAGLIIACATVLHAQEVYIDSLDGNGQLTVTAPSNSDFTVEWASSLTPSPDWQSNWMDLKNIHCTNETMTVDVLPGELLDEWVVCQNTDRTNLHL